MGFQLDWTETKEEALLRQKKHDEAQLSLPVDILQETFSDEYPPLKEHELQIISMILSGLSIDEIALTIFRTRYCVKWRFTGIYHKFNVKNRLQLIKKATKEGLRFTNEETGIKHTFKNLIQFSEYMK